MRFYLRIVIPTIALLSFLLCTWAAIFNDNEFHLFGIVSGYLTSYFFAKGLFTSSALFLLGKLLESSLGAQSAGKRNPRSEFFLFAAFLIASIGLLSSLFLWGKPEPTTETVAKYEITNPDDLKVARYYHVKETDKLKISVVLHNESKIHWRDAIVRSKLYLGERYSGAGSVSCGELKPNQTEELLIEFSEINNSMVNDSVSCTFVIEANPLQ